MWKSPLGPRSYSPNQDHLFQPWKGAFGLQGEYACSVIPYSSKDPTKSGSFMAQRDLKNNLPPVPIPFYHKVTEVQKIKNSLSQVKNSHVQMWELDHIESWALKNWCFQTMVLEKTLESPLDCREIKPVNPKGNQPWILIRRTDAEAEAPILPMQRANSLEETVTLGKIEDKRRRV